MTHWHFAIANIGLWLGLSFSHKKASSSTPSNPTAGALQADFSSANSESWFFF